MGIKIISIICVILLLLGIPSGWPYGYYIFLRWAISLLSVFIAYQAYKLERNLWIYIFAGMAILFNPIAPVYLDKSAWVLIDVVCAGMFLASTFATKKNG
jgi:hypothetical protein